MNSQYETTKSRKRSKKRRYLLFLLLLLILIMVGRCGVERHRVLVGFDKSVSDFERAIDSISSVSDIELAKELLFELIGYEQYEYIECCSDEYRERLADTLIVIGDSMARDGVYSEAVVYYHSASEFGGTEIVTKRIETCEGLQNAKVLIEQEKFAEAKNMLANIFADSTVFGNTIKALIDRCADGIRLAKATTTTVDTTRQMPNGKYYIERALDANIEMVFVKGGHFEIVREMFLSPPPRFPFDGDIDDFYIGRYEITQEQWEKVMGTTLSQQMQIIDAKFRKQQTEDSNSDYEEEDCCDVFEIGADYPMTYISWEDAMEFCRRLSQLTGKNYILPNEIQWQYAASGGIHGNVKYKYSGSNNIDEVGWYGENSGGKPHPIGQKRSNALGLYDMCGNAAEWCSRRYVSFNVTECRWIEYDDKQASTQYYCSICMGGHFLSSRKYCLICCVEPARPWKTTGFRICMIP